MSLSRQRPADRRPVPAHRPRLAHHARHRRSRASRASASRSGPHDRRRRQPVNDALIEIWQANAAGKYAHPEDTQDKPLDAAFAASAAFRPTPRARFRFSTIKPGRVPGPGGKLQAPHLVVAIFMRGLLKQLVTRIYFPDEPANAEDPVLKLVPAARRATLVARRSGKDALEWNVVLQGKDETVFFDF